MSLRARLCHALRLTPVLLALAGCSADSSVLPSDDLEPDASVLDPAPSDGTDPGPISVSPVQKAPDDPPLQQPSTQPQTEPPRLCPWGSKLVTSDGSAAATEPLADEPELIADGVFWSITLAGDALYAIEGPSLGALSSKGATVTRYDLDSFERSLVFTAADGLVEPTAVLAHGGDLYVDDWGTRTLYQSPIADPRLDVLATDVGGDRVLSRFGGSLFLSDYRGSRVTRVYDASLEDGDTPDAALLPESVAVEQLTEVPYPSGSAAWPGHAAWGTHGNDANVDNQLIVWSLEEQEPFALDVGGLVASIDASDQELSWAVYGVDGSELSRAPLDASGALDANALRTLRLCGQPTSTALDGSLAVYGAGPGLVLWEREASVVRTAMVGLVLEVALDQSFVYYITPNGLYRLPRP